MSPLEEYSSPQIETTPPGEEPTPSEVAQERRRRRCFHRVICGLEIGGSLRLLTLTSSPQAVNNMQRDWRRLYMRLRRRNLITGYIKVHEYTDSGLEHIHVIYRGDYIGQRAISAAWNEIHQSPIVHIKHVNLRRRSKARVANYLAKYMSKDLYKRYSWSWGWVYRGFVKVWQKATRLFSKLSHLQSYQPNWSSFLALWHVHLKTHSPPDQLLILIASNVQKLYATNNKPVTFKQQACSL